MPTPSNDQIRALTFSQVTFPKEIDDAASSKATLEKQKAASKKLDDSYVIYTDFYGPLILSYQRESAVLDGNVLAEYNTANIESSARRDSGNVHFPTSPVWVNFIPKMTNANTLTVSSTIVSQNTRIADVVTWANYLVATYTEAERLSGAKIPPVVFPAVDPVPADLATMNIRVNSLSTTVTNQKTQLLANTTENSTEIAENTAEIAKSDILAAAIAAWLGIAGNNKYSNANLIAIRDASLVKSTSNPTRLAQISTAIGSLAQDAAGIYTGNGYYKVMFTWIDTRIATLTAYYGKDVGIRYLDSSIATMNSFLGEIAKDYYSKTLIHDASTTAKEIDVRDGTGFAVSDAVSICDNKSAIISKTITAISADKTELDADGNITVYKTFTLNSALGIAITKAEYARVFKTL